MGRGLDSGVLLRDDANICGHRGIMVLEKNFRGEAWNE